MPHVGCDVVVAFYGYAGGARTATLRFEGQVPTRATTGSDVVLEDTLAFPGGTGLDASGPTASTCPASPSMRSRVCTWS